MVEQKLQVGRKNFHKILNYTALRQSEPVFSSLISHQISTKHKLTHCQLWRMMDP